MYVVTQSFFNDFKKAFDLEDLREDDSFELFATYCVVSKFIKTETITKELLVDTNVGAGGDWGIDAIIVIVNGQVITSKEDLSELLKVNAEIRCRIICVQAKISENFNSAELGQTLAGIENILRDVSGEKALPDANDDINRFREIIKYVYENTAKFQEFRNPELFVYYVSPGLYKAQNDFVSKLKSTSDFVETTNLVSSFTPEVIDRHGISEYYSNAKAKIEATITVERKLDLPEVEHVKEAYLLLLPFSEYRKLILDENGKLRHQAFYENIRDFQGENTVNRGIAETLRRGDLALFTSMNNGITIITRAIQVTGKHILLKDYQIVNGCQTSNVLYRNLDVPGIDDLVLSVKLICSIDKDIRDNIIVGTNSQTEVHREQLVSLLDALKYIENYYNAQKAFDKLYFERRSKQYSNGNEMKVPSSRVITIAFQIQSFVAMMMGEPNHVRGYYGQIVQEFDKAGRKIFSEDTNPALYYTSALAGYKMTEAFSKGKIHPRYKKIKFFVLYAFRLMCEKSKLPAFNSNKVQEYCDHLCSILCNPERCLQGFSAATMLIDAVMNDNNVTDVEQLSRRFLQRDLNKKLQEVHKRQKELPH